MRSPALVLCAVLCATALTAASDGLRVRGVGGRAFALFAPRGAASAIFFVASDCPISNWYAPTIQQVCRDFAARGVDSTLVYEDVDLGAIRSTDEKLLTFWSNDSLFVMPLTGDRTPVEMVNARGGRFSPDGRLRWCSCPSRRSLW